MFILFDLYGELIIHFHDQIFFLQDLISKLSD